MYLEIDMGNTRTKWRVRQGRQILDRGFFYTGTSPDLLESSLVPCVGKLRAVWIASVASEDLESRMAAWIQDNFSIQPLFAQSSVAIGKIKNGYLEPKKLGVDRWLAILAAYHKAAGACMVVSLGTAATVDAIDQDGKHLGGFIGPGLTLITNALLAGTSRIQLSNEDIVLSPDFGVSTSSAICAGCTSMLFGLVDNAMAQMRSKIGEAPFEIIFTGGDAARLMPFYPSARLINDLVLDGLGYVMQGDTLWSNE